MNFRSGVISCLWVAVLLISGTASQNCIIRDGAGIEIPPGQDIFLSDISDSSPPDTTVASLEIESVTSVTVEETTYFATEISDGTLNFITTEDFSTVEENEVASLIPFTISMVCEDGLTQARPVRVILDLSNNFPPQFDETEFTFKLPMPFPPGIAINTAYEVPINAFDVDIYNENVTFEIDDPTGNFEIETLEDEITIPGQAKVRYGAVIRAKRLLTLSELTTFTIIALDNEGTEQKTAEATVTIDVDIENSTPITFGFESSFYTGEDEDPLEIGPIATNDEIKLVQPPDATDIQVTLSPAPGNLPSFENKFQGTYDLEENVVTIEQIEAFTDEDTIPPSLALEIEISDATSGFVARTVLHISLPAEECEGTESPCTTCAPCTCPTETPPTCAPCSTPFPTLSPTCPTCAPCTTTTPKPPSSIEFEKESYSATKGAAETGEVFTVKATHTGGTGTIKYGFVASEELSSRLNMDANTGFLTLTRPAAPGSYEFVLTARYVETNDIARVPGFLDITSFGECEDDSTCFKYALVTTEAKEEEETADLIPGAQPTDPNCIFRIDDVSSEFDGWFEINEDTGALKSLAAVNYEDNAFAEVDTPQVLLRLQVECSTTPATRDSFNASVRPRLQEAVTKQQMMVVVNIVNVNEHPPQFAESELRVGYPDREFARQIFPGAIVQVLATDADKGDDERIRYRQEFITDKFELNEITGELFPVDGKYDYQNIQLNILALDSDGANGALQGRLRLQVQIVKEDEVAVANIEGATIEEASIIIRDLNSKLPTHVWGSLRNSLIAEDLDGQVQNQQSARTSAGGLVLVLYALNKETNWPANHDKIKELLDGYQPGSGWTLAGIQTWEEAGGWVNDDGEGGNNGNGNEEGLTIAVIVLSVILALCVIAIAAIIYVVVFRRNRLDKIRAQVGVKNRTSFSKHRESIAVEVAKRTHVNGLELPTKPESEMEERKKSTVKFNEEPEVIPSNDYEPVRL